MTIVIMTDHILRAREVAVHKPHCPLPRVSSALYRVVSPEPPVPSVRKESPVGDNRHRWHCRLFYGSSYSDPTPRDCRAQPLVICDKKSEGTCNNQHLDLTWQNQTEFYLQCPNSNSNKWFCSSAESRQECTLTRELGRV